MLSHLSHARASAGYVFGSWVRSEHKKAPPSKEWRRCSRPEASLAIEPDSQPAALRPCAMIVQALALQVRLESLRENRTCSVLGTPAFIVRTKISVGRERAINEHGV